MCKTQQMMGIRYNVIVNMHLADPTLQDVRTKSFKVKGE